jgi:hypothetical protein
MNTYKVYYLNNFLMPFRTREHAMDYIMHKVSQKCGSIEDYEILDRSDEL